MTKADAIDAMNKGMKVVHCTFCKGEWITIKKDKGVIVLLDENGYHLNWPLFWQDRPGPEWNEGWKILLEIKF